MFIYNKFDDGARASLMGAIFEDERDALAACLADADGSPLDLWLNSPGGDLSAAFAMRSMLSDYAGSVTVHCSGVVASAATVLLCASGVRVVGHRGSVFMIHAPSAWAEGSADDMKKAAEALDVITGELVQVYAQRLTVDEAAIRSMIKKETWLSLEKAFSSGLVDEIEAPIATVSEPSFETTAPSASAALDIVNALSDKVAQLGGLLAESLAASKRDDVLAIVSNLSDRMLSIEKTSAETASRVVSLEKISTETVTGLKKVSEGVSRAYALDYGAPPVNTYHDTQRSQTNGFKLNSSCGH